jgi:hypothetical protein
VKVLTRLAELVQSRDLADLPSARLDRLKLHIVDTLGARLAGSCTDEGMAIGRLAASMPDRLAGTVLAGCAQARSTEIDDIHLTSCTTPGSVVVPTALALAAAGELRSVRDVCAAALAGYEALIRLGYAIDGPASLRKKVWPTHFAAAFGSAATACRAYGLSVDQTAGALATALAFGSGTPVSAALPSSSRWMTLGVAAASGVLAARGAREGLLGTAGDVVWAARHTRDLGRRFLFDDIGAKPYPTRAAGARRDRGGAPDFRCRAAGTHRDRRDCGAPAGVAAGHCRPPGDADDALRLDCQRAISDRAGVDRARAAARRPADAAVRRRPRARADVEDSRAPGARAGQVLPESVACARRDQGPRPAA